MLCIDDLSQNSVERIRTQAKTMQSASMQTLHNQMWHLLSARNSRGSPFAYVYYIHGDVFSTRGCLASWCKRCRFAPVTTTACSTTASVDYIVEDEVRRGMWWAWACLPTCLCGRDANEEGQVALNSPSKLVGT